MNFHDRLVRAASAIIFFCLLGVQLVPQYDPYFPLWYDSFFFSKSRTVRYGRPVTLYEYQQTRVTYEELQFFPTDEILNAKTVLELFKINGEPQSDAPPIVSQQVAPAEVVNQKGTFLPGFR